MTRLITEPAHHSEPDDEELRENFARHSPRRPLRARQQPVQQLAYRELKRSETLEDLPLIMGGVLKGDARCRAIGLLRGDCRERRKHGSAYCPYHDKLQKGLTEPSGELYPVWPLPENGYVLIEDDEVAA